MFEKCTKLSAQGEEPNTVMFIWPERVLLLDFTNAPRLQQYKTGAATITIVITAAVVMNTLVYRDATAMLQHIKVWRTM